MVRKMSFRILLFAGIFAFAAQTFSGSVSYTHLDVYKRQKLSFLQLIVPCTNQKSLKASI